MGIVNTVLLEQPAVLPVLLVKHTTAPIQDVLTVLWGPPTVAVVVQHQSPTVVADVQPALAMLHAPTEQSRAMLVIIRVATLV